VSEAHWPEVQADVAVAGTETLVPTTAVSSDTVEFASFTTTPVPPINRAVERNARCSTPPDTFQAPVVAVHVAIGMPSAGKLESADVTQPEPTTVSAPPVPTVIEPLEPTKR